MTNFHKLHRSKQEDLDIGHLTLVPVCLVLVVPSPGLSLGLLLFDLGHVLETGNKNMT